MSCCSSAAPWPRAVPVRTSEPRRSAIPHAMDPAFSVVLMTRMQQQKPDLWAEDSGR
jgi:hypothetical protein